MANDHRGHRIHGQGIQARVGEHTACLRQPSFACRCSYWCNPQERLPLPAMPSANCSLAKVYDEKCSTRFDDDQKKSNRHDGVILANSRAVKRAAGGDDSIALADWLRLISVWPPRCLTSVYLLHHPHLRQTHLQCRQTGSDSGISSV